MIAYLQDESEVKVLGEYDNSVRSIDTDETIYITHEKPRVKPDHEDIRQTNVRVLRRESELTFQMEKAS